MKEEERIRCPIHDLINFKRSREEDVLLWELIHGPYSHVFEEISDHFELGRYHESYTLEIIDTPEIRDILTRFDVYNRTRQFFSKEPGYSVFDAIISSQMDCDRLDFLCRDRHHTGIRSAALDLEWLFDSLRIEQIPVDDAGVATEYSFVLSEKGLAVAEEFVIAYMKMYQNVYFHKTTRGVQYLVRDMLIDLLSKTEHQPEIKALPIAKFFREAAQLSTYLALDDTSVVTAAHVAASNDWGRASDLARRFLKRDVYKCFELPSTATGNVPRNKLERFRSRLRDEGIYFVEDIISHRSYKQHAVTDTNFIKNILIKNEGEIESLGNVSGLLKAPAPRVARIYLENAQARDRAREIYQTC